MSPRRRYLRHVPLLALLLASGPTCRARDPLAPGLPGRGALDVSPLFETTFSDGPIIELRKARALLIRRTTGGKDTTSAEASFENGAAMLRLEVTVAAPSQLFALQIEALDTLGVVMFRGDDTVRIAPGPNPERTAPQLRYAAPDTALRTLVLSPEQVVLAPGDSLRLKVAGFGEDSTPVAPVALGWTSRATSIAAVSAQGTVTAGELDGSAWIVARTFTGVADSVLVKVHGSVASVVISPDRQPSATLGVRGVAGGSAALSMASPLSRMFARSFRIDP